MTLASAPLRVVLYEGPGAQPLENERRLELMSALLEAGYALTRPPTGKQGQGSVTPADGAPLVLLGQFEDGQVPEVQSQGPVHVQELNGTDSETLVNRIAAIREEAELPLPGAWTPWFPVIDYQRCTNCMQCLSF